MADSENNNANNSLSESELDNLKDYCLTNLKILSKINQGDKLAFTDNVFAIDPWTYTQPISRWFNNESRLTTIKHLEEFIVKVFKAIDNIYSSEMNLNFSGIENTYYIKNIHSKTIPIFKEENSALLLTFITEMKNAIVGLNNLKQTYKTDITTISAIDIIIEKMNVRIKKISGILSIEKHDSRSGQSSSSGY